MIISHSKRFVMFQPWKTASSTIWERLKPFDESPYPKFFSFNPYLNRVTHQHITCSDFACLPESRLGYVAASFVRNPYDRVYSGFRQIQKDIRDQPQCAYPDPWIRTLVMKQLAENATQIRSGFDDWMDIVSEDQIYEAGRNTNFPLHPAHYWTHIAGRQVVNFVGRVENFESDFQVFLDLVGIGAVPAVNANVAECGAVQNPHGYRYVDRMHARSIDKINRMFERDFDIFGYPIP